MSQDFVRFVEFVIEGSGGCGRHHSAWAALRSWHRNFVRLDDLVSVNFNTMTLSAGDTAWMLMSCGLVNLMTPGLAFFYGGLVRQQNVLTMIMQNYVSMGLMTICWIVWGSWGHEKKFRIIGGARGCEGGLMNHAVPRNKLRKILIALRGRDQCQANGIIRQGQKNN